MLPDIKILSIRCLVLKKIILMNKLLYILFFFTVLNSGAFSQNTIIVLMSRNNYSVDKINFRINNNDSALYYYNVQLEKYDFEKSQYLSYSKDVFSDSEFPQELTVSIESKSNKNFSFNIRQSEWLQVSKRKRNIVNSSSNKIKNNELEKKGVFRLKVFYGKDEFNKTTIIYSDDFIIK